MRTTTSYVNLFPEAKTTPREKKSVAEVGSKRKYHQGQGSPTGYSGAYKRSMEGGPTVQAHAMTQVIGAAPTLHPKVVRKLLVIPRPSRGSLDYVLLIRGVDEARGASLPIALGGCQSGCDA